MVKFIAPAFVLASLLGGAISTPTAACANLANDIATLQKPNADLQTAMGQLVCTNNAAGVNSFAVCAYSRALLAGSLIPSYSESGPDCSNDNQYPKGI